MKKLWEIAQPVGLLCILVACFLAALNAIAVIAASFGFTGTFNYIQYFRVPLWSVALPAAGILAFLPLALRQAFTWESAVEEKKKAEPVNWRRAVERWRSRLHLRPV